MPSTGCCGGHRPAGRLRLRVLLSVRDVASAASAGKDSCAPSSAPSGAGRYGPVALMTIVALLIGACRRRRPAGSCLRPALGARRLERRELGASGATSSRPRAPSSRRAAELSTRATRSRARRATRDARGEAARDGRASRRRPSTRSARALPRRRRASASRRRSPRSAALGDLGKLVDEHRGSAGPARTCGRADGQLELLASGRASLAVALGQHAVARPLGRDPARTDPRVRRDGARASTSSPRHDAGRRGRAGPTSSSTSRAGRTS